MTSVASSTTVLTERAGGTMVATLNRPEVLNAFNPELIDRLARVVDEAADDPAVKVLLIRGAGTAFSSGFDLRASTTRKYEFQTGALLKKLTLLTKPVVLAIDGAAVGIGATICGLADLVIMSDRARLKCPFVRLGLNPEAGSTFQFPRLLGPQLANWFLLSGAWLSAQECLNAGLALEVVRPDELDERARARCDVLAGQPLDSLTETKRLIRAPHMEQLIAAIKAENAAVTRLKAAPAFAEAQEAFRARRGVTS